MQGQVDQLINHIPTIILFLVEVVFIKCAGSNKTNLSRF